MERHPTRNATWVRVWLILLAIGLTAVFWTAIRLEPYEPDGTAKLLETHTQLGLPPCTFRVLTGTPCPACGLTTSFALFVRGDLANAWHANAVGIVLALMGIIAIPWAIAGAWHRKALWGRHLERYGLFVLCTIMALLIGRWIFIVGWQGIARLISGLLPT